MSLLTNSSASWMRLPTTGELAEVLGLNKNTVLAAFRGLRDEGLLEFRRGRGVRVAGRAAEPPAVIAAAREFIRVAADHGYQGASLYELLGRIEGTW